ncbi:hypothetical protein TWF730_000158 [Orbilia blumenaviensis]|uniref:Fucose-specific lectin n=1 Tax=Orbilia blumenaviensis TaxID=1796055 RepID=A0AAV9VLT9_9PEZI
MGKGIPMYISSKQNLQEDTSTRPLLVASSYAVVKASTPGLDNNLGTTYFFQQAFNENNPRTDKLIWFSCLGTSGFWSEPSIVQELNPPPRDNSSIAAVQIPGEDQISLFYVAENGTLYDVIGAPADKSDYSSPWRWKRGSLAPFTGWEARVSKNSGIAATWTFDSKLVSVPDNELWRSRYVLRVYYVDSVTSTVRELSRVSEGISRVRWYLSHIGENCSPQAKITVAHLLPNSTNQGKETVHLFYESRNRSGIRHAPIYNHTWNPEYVTTIMPNSVLDSYFAATISSDEGNMITLFYLDADTRLQQITGRGRSKNEYPDYDPLTEAQFSEPQLVEGFRLPSRYTTGDVGGGALAALWWLDESRRQNVRILYRPDPEVSPLEEETKEIWGFYKTKSFGDYFRWVGVKNISLNITRPTR